jgi:hypothetical protein
MHKGELLKNVHANPLYQAALRSARSDAERQRIVQLVEGFVGDIAETLEPMIERARADSEFAQQLGQALVGQQRVVTSERVNSGLSGQND